MHLSVPDEATRFSDNYFDLEPDESRTIVVANSRGNLAPEMIAAGWR